jgi:TolB-like protein
MFSGTMTMEYMHDGSRPAEAAAATSPEMLAPPVARPVAADRREKAAKKAKRKAARLRGVWISFTGRIVAQFVGSAASILLGLSLLHGYASPPADSASSAPSLVAEPYRGRVVPASSAGARVRHSLLVLPMDDYSPGAEPGDRFALALTEAVTASLAERGSLAVLSRTSASQVDTRRRSMPAIAGEMGVDFVLEASVTKVENRVRVVAQLIDGRSDEHLWTGRYDGELGDTLGLQAQVANQIAVGIEAALSRSAIRSSGTSERSSTSEREKPIVAPVRATRQAEPASPSVVDLEARPVFRD